jgi:nitrite reductase/ring-hydroxylating ferredoxin subunit
MTDAARMICRIDELPDPGSRAFTLGTGDWPLRGFVVRRGEGIFAYLNRCPHAGHPLNWQPDRFLTADQALIVCSSHGALFDIASGACMGGPCAGRGLRTIEVEVIEGCVMLADDPDKLAATYA